MAEQDDISPWARDDWSSADSPATESSTPPIDPVPPVVHRAAAPRPHGTQVWIAAAFGAVLLIGGMVALVRNDSADRPATGSAGTVSGAEPSADTVELSGGPTATTATGGVPTFWNDDPVETTEPAASVELAMAVSEAGEVPLWNTSSIDVPEPLDAMSVATEVVAFGAEGILYRIQVPSGQVRAMRMSSWDAGARAVVGVDAIVVFTSTSVTIIRDDEPIIEVPMSQGVIFVEPWPGTDQFIVTTPSLAVSGGEQPLVLGLDGALTPIGTDFVIGDIFGERTFLPDGRVAINRPGGVYAIGIDQSATRLSDGDLLAVGAAHYAVQECDETLRCATFVVETNSGERTEATLGALTDGRGFKGPSSRISPDGRKIVFTDPSRDGGVRRLLDVATGEAFDVGGVNEILYSDSWAADSSGIFTKDGGSIAFRTADNSGGVVVGEFDDVTSVATRPVSSDG